MHWDDGDGGTEVGRELMGEATADSNMGEEGSHHQPPALCIALHAEGVQPSQVIM